MTDQDDESTDRFPAPYDDLYDVDGNLVEPVDHDANLAAMRARAAEG